MFLLLDYFEYTPLCVFFARGKWEDGRQRRKRPPVSPSGSPHVPTSLVQKEGDPEEPSLVISLAQLAKLFWVRGRWAQDWGNNDVLSDSTGMGRPRHGKGSS